MSRLFQSKYSKDNSQGSMLNFSNILECIWSEDKDWIIKEAKLMIVWSQDDFEIGVEL